MNKIENKQKQNYNKIIKDRLTHLHNKFEFNNLLEILFKKLAMDREKFEKNLIIYIDNKFDNLYKEKNINKKYTNFDEINHLNKIKETLNSINKKIIKEKKLTKDKNNLNNHLINEIDKIYKKNIKIEKNLVQNNNWNFINKIQEIIKSLNIEINLEKFERFKNYLEIQNILKNFP